MSSLSDDVWYKVAEILSATSAKGTLASLAQTSQHLYTLVTPLLYESIVLSPYRTRRRIGGIAYVDGYEYDSDNEEYLFTYRTIRSVLECLADNAYNAYYVKNIVSEKHVHDSWSKIQFPLLKSVELREGFDFDGGQKFWQDNSVFDSLTISCDFHDMLTFMEQQCAYRCEDDHQRFFPLNQIKWKFQMLEPGIGVEVDDVSLLIQSFNRLHVSSINLNMHEILSENKLFWAIVNTPQVHLESLSIDRPTSLSELDESKLEHIVTLRITESFTAADVMRFKLPNLKRLELVLGPEITDPDSVEMHALVWLVLNLKTLNHIISRGETYSSAMINFIRRNVPSSNKGTSINELVVEYNHLRSMNLLNGRFNRGAMRLSVHGQYDRVKTLLQAKRKRDVEALETYKRLNIALDQEMFHQDD